MTEPIPPAKAPRPVSDRPRKPTGSRRRGADDRLPGQPLPDPRQERYAQARAAGKTQVQAHKTAGYEADYPDRAASNIEARNVDVRQRIAELRDHGMKMADLSPDIVVAGLAKEATTALEGGTRTRAWELLGKAQRMFVDQIETKVLVAAADEQVARDLALKELLTEAHPRFAERYQWHLRFLRGEAVATEEGQ